MGKGLGLVGVEHDGQPASAGDSRIYISRGSCLTGGFLTCGLGSATKIPFDCAIFGGAGSLFGWVGTIGRALGQTETDAG